MYNEGKVSQRQVLEQFWSTGFDELSTSISTARDRANIRVDADFGTLNLLLVHRPSKSVLNGGAPLHFIILAGGSLLVILKVEVVVLALIIVE